MIGVIDASAAVNLVLPGPIGAAVAAAVDGLELCAPGIIDAEVASALARLERTGDLLTLDAARAVRLWKRLPVERFSMASLFADAWTARNAMRVADAFYICLARRLDCPLITCDGRLARTPGVGVPVTLVSYSGSTA